MAAITPLKESTKRLIKRSIGALFIAGGLVFIAFAVIINSISLPPRARQVSNLRRVGAYLHDYADRHGGQMPHRVVDLAPEFFASTDDPCLTYRDPVTKHQYYWLYYRRVTITDLPPDTIIAAAPKTCPGTDTPIVRLVLYSDGIARWAPEQEFQRQLDAQRTQ